MIDLLLSIAIIASPLPIEAAPNDASGSAVGPRRCGRLNSHALARRIRAFKTEDPLRPGMSVVHLLNYWYSRCSQARFNAPAQDVQSLAGLLRLSYHRYNLSLILFEVGPNLRAAIPALEHALADNDQKLARARADSVWGFVMPDYNGDPLRCVLEKARTGRVNEDLCESLVASARRNRADGE